jgi:putative phosphonate metabolism protein
MSDLRPRYALYYAPRQDESLAREASQWLGWNPDGGRACRLTPALGYDTDRLAEITAEPRRYGFHGTLKPPMVLADGASEAEFLAAVGSFAATLQPFTIPAMVLAEISGFLALVPTVRVVELCDLADRCVIEFDEFRRPAGDAELARRRAAGLSPRQDQLLTRWGYPYVLEEWRFHLTLTGRIDDSAERAAVLDLLRRRFSGSLDRPLSVRDICVFRQNTPESAFTVLARFRLGGGRLVRSEVWRSS